MIAVVLAHQGGWDEILLVVGPILIIAALLWIAKRRVEQAAARGGDPTIGDRSTGDPMRGDRPGPESPISHRPASDPSES